MRKLVIAGFVLLFLAFMFSISQAGEIKVLNEAAPGSTVDIEKHVEKGKTTIFDFYAEWCGPCRNIAPYLEKLQEKDSSVVVKKINIDKWNSPVCQQYKIRSVPFFRIYDSSGRLQYEGKEAYSKVMEMIKK